MNVVEVIARQREEINCLREREFVEREAEEKMRKWIDKDIIKVVTGVRRAGKSTLCYLVLRDRDFGYVNFDEKVLVSADPENILEAVREIYGSTKYLLLDEIQNLPDWELWVNSLYRRGYNLIITGSNANLLSRELSTHLTGRYIDTEIYPFSFREVLRCLKYDCSNVDLLREKQGNLKSILRDYLTKGGFPEIWVKELGKEYLETLFDAIVYKDVVRRWNVKYPVELENLAKYLLSMFSSKYSISKLKNLLQFRSKATVEKYIKHLEDAYLLFSLQAFSFKEKERIKSPRKIYSVDTGIVNAVASFTSPNLGRLMENVAFLDLCRRKKPNRDLFYLSAKGYEVDFVVKDGLKVEQLIQVTYASDFDEVDAREWKALLKAKEVFGEHKPRLTVITWDYEDVRELSWFGRNGVVEFVPLWRWLLNCGY